MKTIEQRAIDYAEANVSYGMSKEMAIRAYIAGATEALAGQWHTYPEDDFPEDGNEYIVLTSSGDYCAVNKYARKEMVKQYQNIIAWMAIPEPPKPEEE